MTSRSGRRPRIAAAATLCALLSSSALALAWSHDATFEAHVHGHAFTHASLESSGCKLKLRVLFDAPESAYKSEAPARNFYRFHVRVQLDDDRAVVTPVFSNSSPGARSYATTLDTSADGCWAKSEHQLRGVKVEGCRGAGCTPEPFK